MNVLGDMPFLVNKLLFEDTAFRNEGWTLPRNSWNARLLQFMRPSVAGPLVDLLWATKGVLCTGADTFVKRLCPRWMEAESESDRPSDECGLDSLPLRELRDPWCLAAVGIGASGSTRVIWHVFNIE